MAVTLMLILIVIASAFTGVTLRRFLQGEHRLTLFAAPDTLTPRRRTADPADDSGGPEEPPLAASAALSVQGTRRIAPEDGAPDPTWRVGVDRDQRGTDA